MDSDSLAIALRKTSANSKKKIKKTAARIFFKNRANVKHFYFDAIFLLKGMFNKNVWTYRKISNVIIIFGYVDESFQKRSLYQPK